MPLINIGLTRSSMNRTHPMHICSRINDHGKQTKKSWQHISYTLLICDGNGFCHAHVMKAMYYKKYVYKGLLVTVKVVHVNVCEWCLYILHPEIYSTSWNHFSQTGICTYTWRKTKKNYIFTQCFVILFLYSLPSLNKLSWMLVYDTWSQ